MKKPGIVPWFFVPKNGVKMGFLRPLLSYSLSLKMGFPPKKGNSKCIQKRHQPKLVNAFVKY